MLHSTRTAGLHADEAALDEVDAPDAVVTSELVERSQQGGWAHLDAINGDGVALEKLNLNLGGLVGGLPRISQS